LRQLEACTLDGGCVAPGVEQPDGDEEGEEECDEAVAHGAYQVVVPAGEFRLLMDAIEEDHAFGNAVVAPAGFILRLTRKLRNRFEGIPHDAGIAHQFGAREVGLAFAGTAEVAEHQAEEHPHHPQPDHQLHQRRQGVVRAHHAMLREAPEQGAQDPRQPVVDQEGDHDGRIGEEEVQPQVPMTGMPELMPEHRKHLRRRQIAHQVVGEEHIAQARHHADHRGIVDPTTGHRPAHQPGDPHAHVPAGVPHQRLASSLANIGFAPHRGISSSGRTISRTIMNSWAR
jgi:hypothetical protein